MRKTFQPAAMVAEDLNTNVWGIFVNFKKMYF